MVCDGARLAMDDRDKSCAVKWGSWFFGMVRGMAMFLGGFTLLNLVGELRASGFDANEWWIDLRVLPAGLADGVLAVAGVVLVMFAVRPLRTAAERVVTRMVLWGLVGATFFNAVVFWVLVWRGEIRPGVVVPLSAVICAALAVLLAASAQKEARRLGGGGRFVAMLSFAVCMVGFPVAQMYCYGKTDYRRPADAIVVFGARTYADGRPSQALADRVRTACGLYNAGLARVMIMSGGPGDGAVHETEAMRRMAMELGVPGDAILMDKEGLNTDATVKNTVPMLEKMGAQRVLAVSHFYHLPRVKMTYERAGKMVVFTVPAEETYPLMMLPRYMAREVVALWGYYLRPLWRSGRG